MTVSTVEERRTFARRNPIDGNVVSNTHAMSADEAIAVVDTAAQAFPAWSQTGPNARRALLWAAADAVLAHKDALVDAMIAETASAPSWCAFNVTLAARMLREAASITTQISGEVIPSDKPGFIAMATRQPVGVSLGIAPWNAPIILGTRAIAVALACGNTAILKASEVCPKTHLLLADVIASAGFPAGVIGVVTHASEDAASVVAALIAHPEVKRVNFTGSTHVGRIIGRLAGEALKPALLELGGKAPLLVLDDADLDLAVKAASFGAFMHQGQICMSTERIVVDASVADAFVEKLATKARSMTVGDPRKEEVVLGSLIDLGAVERVQSLVADAVAHGAQIAAGGEASGTFMQATIVDHVTDAMQIFREETFGPCVTVIRVNGDEEAIRVANDTEFGLSAAVISRDFARALKVAQRIESGMCHINGPTVQDEAQMPFGGVKASGHGRFGGRQGIEFFSETRWITIETQEPHFPI